MITPTEFLMTLGGILLLGLATDLLGHRTFLPRVTLLLLLGVMIGKDFLNLIPVSFTANFELVANMSLLMIGFVLGGRLTKKSLASSGGRILWISLTAAIGTTLLVTTVLLVIGIPSAIAILLGSIASATAPSATVDAVLETGSKSRFSDLLLAVVAIDDVWGLVLFSVAVSLVSSLTALGFELAQLASAFAEIGGALLLGIIVGFPAAYLTGRIRPGQPMLMEALGVVFLAGGLAMWLEVSFLITAMVLGAIVANFARHHDRPFHEIENIEWPFLAIFFVLAGASLKVNSLKEIGLLGLVYILARIVGKILGAAAGSRISHCDMRTGKWMGVALLPQAGVAIGMALVAGNMFPAYRQVLLTVVISSTVFFEVVGPVFTRLALERTR